jgi:hypothetical protein
MGRAGALPLGVDLACRSCMEFSMSSFSSRMMEWLGSWYDTSLKASLLLVPFPLFVIGMTVISEVTNPVDISRQNRTVRT